MLKAAAQNGWLDNDKVIIESLTCIKRAGADHNDFHLCCQRSCYSFKSLGPLIQLSFPLFSFQPNGGEATKRAQTCSQSGAQVQEFSEPNFLK